MRIAPLRAVLFGLVFATGCTVGDVGGPNGGDGDDSPADSTDVSSDDDGIAVDAAAPKLTATVDKPTWMSELGTANMLTMSLQGSDGFAGAVNVTATVTDAAGLPMAGWTVELSDAVVNLPADGAGTVVATVNAPSVNSGLAAKVSFLVTSSLTPSLTVDSSGTLLDQVTIPITRTGGGNQCAYPSVPTTRVKRGTKVRFLNADEADPIRIHVDGNGTGIPHQPSDMGAGEAYEIVPTGAGSASWYCHTPGNNPGNLRVEVIE